MRVRWSRVAESDLNGHIDYIADYNPITAAITGEAIRAATRRLAVYPQSGRQGRVDGTRELVVDRTPYILAYRIGPEFVEILRVMHGAQLWPYNFEQ